MTAGNFSGETRICIFTTFDPTPLPFSFCPIFSFDSYHESDDKSPPNRPPTYVALIRRSERSEKTDVEAKMFQEIDGWIHGIQSEIEE